MQEQNKELLKELIRNASKRVKYLALEDKFDSQIYDMSTVFTRVGLDNTHTDFIACKYCFEIFEHGSPPILSQAGIQILYVSHTFSHTILYPMHWFLSYCNFSNSGEI